MQLKSEIWVRAFLRACETKGGMPVVVRHGDDDAGAIYVKLLIPPNLCRVYGPRPIGFDETPVDRLFDSHLGTCPVSEVDADDYLKRQAEFDTDLWVIEVSETAGWPALETWCATSVVASDRDWA